MGPIRFRTPRQAAASQTEGDDSLSLEQENARLRSQVADHEAEKAGRSHPWRQVGVAILVVVGCLLFAFANLAMWVQHTALNTNGWVAAVGPLTRNSDLVDAVSFYIVDELFTDYDVEQLSQEILPGDLKALSGPLSGILQVQATELVAQVIKSDEVNEVWVGVNRHVHHALVSVLRGDGSMLYVREGQVTVDLGDLFASIQDKLGIEDRGLLTEEDTKFAIFSSEKLAGLQRAVAVIDGVGLWLPIITLLVLVGAWLLSLTRRRTLMWIGLGIAITMLVELILYGLVKPAVVAPISEPMIQSLVREILNTVTHTLTVQTVLLLAAGLLVAFGAWFAGPNQWAVDTRTDIGSWFGKNKNQSEQ